jgi:hypothetical protein
MHKIEVLIPDRLMDRMRIVAERIDLPVSEIIRQAAETWLETMPGVKPDSLPPGPVKAGRCLVSAQDMREAIYENE